MRWVGASWEGFVVEQIIGHLAAHGQACDATYFRTSDGHEADLVLDFGNARWVVEAKLTTSPSPADLRKLQRVAQMVGASRALLICRIPKPMDDGHLHCGHLESALEVILARSAD